MNKIKKMKALRNCLLNQIEDLNEEQLNKTPDQYSNNIMWNLAHLICAQQAICYMRAGQKPIVSEKYIAPFFTNTKPERIIANDEIQEIKVLSSARSINWRQTTATTCLQTIRPPRTYSRYTASS